MKVILMSPVDEKLLKTKLADVPKGHLLTLMGSWPVYLRGSTSKDGMYVTLIIVGVKEGISVKGGTSLDVGDMVEYTAGILTEWVSTRPLALGLHRINNGVDEYLIVRGMNQGSISGKFGFDCVSFDKQTLQNMNGDNRFNLRLINIAFEPGYEPETVVMC